LLISSKTNLGSIFFSAVVMLASAIAASTPTPKEGTWQAVVYKIIDFLAINIGKAKQK
jgi:hypothetical protein